MKMIQNKKLLFRLSIILLIMSLLFLTSCSFDRNTSGFQDFDYHKGTDGLLVSFLSQAPPSEVYELTEFDLQLFIENKGAFDLIDGYRASVNVKYDNSVVQPITEEYLGQGLYANKNSIQLYGKSYYFPQGQENFFALDRFIGLPIKGNFEQNKANFYVSICYPYQTFFADEICVDTDPDNMNPRNKICSSETKTYSGGQGAPIAVTKIESQMVPRGVYIQPQFVIELSHVGEGSFSLQKLEKDSFGNQGCSEISIDDVGKVEANVQLGLDTLDCKPNEIIFVNNKATLYCQLPEQKITGIGSNYLTTMSVNIAYNYMQTYEKEVSIVRSQGTIFSNDHEPESDWECYPWEIFVPGEENECINRCDYCAQHQQSPECVVNDLQKDSENPKQFTTNHACVYRSTSDCIEAGNNCILDGGFCQIGTYCGIPQCFESGNNKPTISINEQSAEDSIQFFCYDSDDVMDSSRTCGCEEKAYFLFVSKEFNCEDIPLEEYTPATTGFYNSAKGRMEYMFYLSSIEEENDLCLVVKDKVGAISYKRSSYPWRS